ncbi:KH domain-containing protein NDAI_0I01480 [Naumovozyma dairenensis CBS 421]|uniref:K Homology domain-containing protein n=1 Tax=Naumovozyma dairenensis (strain ATCC 10597 / BCRC 20456 / CBS 421 / NBRC 0211 / NRRL Y-12639) TaxID=1071378 RepID=G0WG06_NAUDC|nr:hypothetical protein NDAI_0I01480 [Naumovozyma dairenensis CBS 421]CCD26717.1 hypothetical protein NDAI_0I01480 [Naumovozyma dairenensis CBS 421]
MSTVTDEMVNETSNLLKRKKDEVVEEKLEAAIKRVALDDIAEIQKKELSVSHDEVSETTDQEEEEVTNYEDDSNKTDDDDLVFLRLLCTVKQASLIVGHRGETISRIKNETSTRINVSENIRGVPERVIYIKGSCENAAKACGQIARVISTTNDKSTTTASNDGTDNEPSSVVVDDDKPSKVLTTINLLLSHHLIGYIIGKHGLRLKEIEDLSAAKLSASRDQLVPSNDRILTVTGVPDAIHIATFYMGQTLLNCKEVSKKKRGIFYQPTPMYSALPNSSYNSSFGGQPQRFYQYHSNNKYNGYRTKRSGRQPVMMMSVESPIPIQQPLMTPVMYTTANAANATSFTPSFSIPHVRTVDNSFPNMSVPSSHLPSVKREIYIDENYVGNIIGKEGKHINSIKETTGCSIIIDDSVEGATERKLTIRGTGMGSQAAIMLISNKIELDRISTQRRNYIKHDI